VSQASTALSRWEKRNALRPRVVSIDEAAKYIGRSRNFVYDLLGSGKVRAVKSGSRTLPILDDLDKYLDSCPFAVVRPVHPVKQEAEDE
jgi:excisionase family DNA binding protein